MTPGELRWRIEFADRLLDWRESRAGLNALRRKLYAKYGGGGLMVYVIRQGEDGPVKIGKTTRDPHERLATLQCGNANDLIGWAAWDALPGEEEFLHSLFAEFHIRGEWFKADDLILDLTAAEGGTFFDPHAFDLDPEYEA